MNRNGECTWNPVETCARDQFQRCHDGFYENFETDTKKIAFFTNICYCSSTTVVFRHQIRRWNYGCCCFFLVFVWYVKVGRDFKAIRHIEHWLFVPDNRNWNRVNIRLLFFAQEATEMLLCKYKISIIPIDSLWLWYTKGVPGNSRDCLDAFYSLFRVYQIETRVAARFRIQYLFAGKNGVFGCLWKKNETFTDFKRNWSIHFCDFR